MGGSRGAQRWAPREKVAPVGGAEAQVAGLGASRLAGGAEKMSAGPAGRAWGDDGGRTARCATRHCVTQSTNETGDETSCVELSEYSRADHAHSSRAASPAVFAGEDAGVRSEGRCPGTIARTSSRGDDKFTGTRGARGAHHVRSPGRKRKLPNRHPTLQHVHSAAKAGPRPLFGPTLSFTLVDVRGIGGRSRRHAYQDVGAHRCCRTLVLLFCDVQGNEWQGIA